MGVRFPRETGIGEIINAVKIFLTPGNVNCLEPQRGSECRAFQARAAVTVLLGAEGRHVYIGATEFVRSRT